MDKSRHYLAGVVGGVVGGIVLGIILALTGALPIIAGLVGSSSSAVGWVVHLIIGIIAGIFFVWWFGNLATTYLSGIGYGLLHALIWWIVGFLILLPLLLGAGVQIGNAFSTGNLIILMGMIVYGFLLGIIYVAVDRPHVAHHPHRAGV